MGLRIHLRNLAFNWGGHAVALLVMFFLSPFVVGKLDAVSYGIWSLLNVLTGYMGIFDLGVRASVGRHVALYLGKNDQRGVDETIRAGFGFFSIAGGLILIIGVLLGWLFPFIFRDIDPEHYNTVRILLPLMVVNVWLSAVAAIYSSILAAHDRFDFVKLVDLSVLAVRTFATVYALNMGWGLYGLAAAVIAGNVLAVIGNRILSGKVHKRLRSFPLFYSRERFKELYKFGSAAFISSSTVKIIGQSDLVLIGALLTVENVREYSIGAMIVLYFGRTLEIISRTFFPAIQRFAAQNNMREVRHLLDSQMLIGFSAGLLGYIGFITFASPFIKLWMFQDGFGENSVSISGAVMIILSTASIPLIFIRPLQSTLFAFGHIKVNTIMSVCEAVFNVIFSLLFVLVFDFGIYGVAFGTLVARLIPGIGMPFLAFKKINGMKRFLVEFIFPGIMISILYIFMCRYIIEKCFPENWTIFFLDVFLSIVLWTILAYLGFFKWRAFFSKNINLAKKKMAKKKGGIS